MRVLARNEDGSLVFDGKRFVTVSGAAAKAQLLRERLCLEPGDDRFFPARGPAFGLLKKANATPAAYASAVAQELALSPLVRSVTAAPAEPSVAQRPLARAVLIKARVVLLSDDEVVDLEVPVG